MIADVFLHLSCGQLLKTLVAGKMDEQFIRRMPYVFSLKSVSYHSNKVIEI